MRKEKITKENLLATDLSININRKLAKYMSLNEVIIFQYIYCKLQYNEKIDENYVAGRYWVCSSIREFSKDLDFLSESTIKRLLQQLEKEGLLITAIYNKYKYDRTKWYSIDYDKIVDFYEKRRIKKQILSIKRTMAGLKGYKVKKRKLYK
ncbi:MAG: hypothetical protein E6555_14315 [Clostridium perfringens]|nr:hypothetical protein [Clostridium perfringens]